MKDDITILIIIAIFMGGIVGAFIDGWIAPLFAIMGIVFIAVMEGVLSISKAKRIEKEFFKISRKVKK